MALVVNNPPPRQETQETWVLSWVGKISLEEEMATHPSILAWRILLVRGAWWATIYGATNRKTRLEQLGTHALKKTMAYTIMLIALGNSRLLLIGYLLEKGTT